MKIQSIQKNNSTNNYQNPKFKATFVNNENFRYFWIHSKRSPKFNQVVDEFLKTENGKLEIRDLRIWNPNMEMSIYNRSNDSERYLSLPRLLSWEDYGLEQLMNGIMKHCEDVFWAPEIKTNNFREEAIKEANKKLYQKFPDETDYQGSTVLSDLIYNSKKSPNYVKNVEKFVNSTDANFEIYENDGIFDKYRWLVMNLKTGAYQELGPIGKKYNIEDLLEEIRTSDVLMKPNSETEIYKKLIGQA